MKAFIFALIFATSYAQEITVNKSWSLLGASENLNSSFFTGTCANAVWTYKNGVWSSEKSVSKGEGFWIFSENGNCSLSTTATTAVATEKLFSTDIFPILQTNCTTSCHSSDGLANNTALIVTDASTTYTGVKTLVDTLNATNSKILLKATAQEAHSGGKVFDITSTQYSTILSWITSGATNN